MMIQLAGSVFVKFIDIPFYSRDVRRCIHQWPCAVVYLVTVVIGYGCYLHGQADLDLCGY